MPPTGIRSVLLVVLALAIWCVAPASATITATARGPVYVRRGPASTSPAFATLAKGSTVTVDLVTGVWASVTLASGERGYVHTAYLDLPPGVPVATVEPTPQPAPPTAPPAADTPTPAVAAPAEVGRQDMELQLAQLRERIAALETAATPAAPVARVERGEDPAGPPERAGASAETPGALPVAPAGAQAQGLGPEREIGLDIGPALALAGVGLVVGFLLGTAYGQRQERSRGRRVRF